MVARVLTLGMVVVLVLLYGPLYGKFGLAQAPSMAKAFVVVYASLSLSILLSIVRAPKIFASLGALLRRHPVRCGIFFLNSLITALIVYKTLTRWGTIAMLACLAITVLIVTLLSEEARPRALGKLVCRSPLSFGILYLALLGGEGLLRMRPQWVGGEGGGNPALRQIYDGLYEYNSFGWRDREWAIQKGEGRRRIVVIGDSFTFGQGIPREETYPVLLEEILSETEVLNLGKPGVNTAWEIGCLRDEAPKFDPDLVLIQFYVNDVEYREYRTAAGKPQVSKSPLDAVHNVFARSYAIFFLRFHFDRSVEAIDLAFAEEKPKTYLENLAINVRTAGRGYRACREALVGMAAWSRESGIPVGLVLFPQPGVDDVSVREVHRHVTQDASEAGLAVLDLREAVNAVPPEKQIAHSFDHHPSGDYNRAAAARIAAWLRDAFKW